LFISDPLSFSERLIRVPEHEEKKTRKERKKADNFKWSLGMKSNFSKYK